MILIHVCSVKRAARRNLLHFFGKRVFIAGLGDSGVLTAIKLARHADVVGISAKPALVSGPELGSRLSGPDLLAPERIDTAKTIGLMGTTAACDLTSRPTLRELRGRLAANRQSKPLFDTPRFTRHFEDALLRAATDAPHMAD